MIYLTTRQSSKFHQMTLEELLFGVSDDTHTSPTVYVADARGNTVTRVIEHTTPIMMSKVNVENLIAKLTAFNECTEPLRRVERNSLYNTFYIPKRNGKPRRIDAPNHKLMEALRELKKIFEDDFGALHHTTAFAYVKHRSTLDAVKRHQTNESKWFGKYDLSNFFGNTTLEFVIKMFGMIFPFSEVMKNKIGRAELEKALELAFLNGGLPQGTPISPTITNIMMIPIDHKISNALRDYNKQCFVYTRYADDFIISSKYNFDFRNIEKFLVDTLNSFGAPFALNKCKTRYGSSSGANWNLGVMLNKDNEITVGAKKKRQFQAMLTSYVLDRQNGTPWELENIQVLEGLRSYYHMVEGDTIEKIVSHIGSKYGVDIPSMIKSDLTK